MAICINTKLDSPLTSSLIAAAWGGRGRASLWPNGRRRTEPQCRDLDMPDGLSNTSLTSGFKILPSPLMLARLVPWALGNFEAVSYPRLDWNRDLRRSIWKSASPRSVNCGVVLQLLGGTFSNGICRMNTKDSASAAQVVYIQP